MMNEKNILLDNRTLTRVILTLTANPEKRAQIGRKLHGFAKPQAALDMAALIAEAAAAKT